MKTSKNSIHYKLYKFTYNEYDLPVNLCPYFWKLVGAVLLFIPNFIIQLPAIIIDYISKDKSYSYQRKENGLLVYCIMGLSYLILYCFYNLILAIFNCYSYNFIASNIGLLIIINIPLFIIGFNWDEIRNFLFGANTTKESKPNIIIEFIKAKKNKYCPKLDWE